MTRLRFFIVGALSLGLTACAGSFAQSLDLNPPVSTGHFNDRVRAAQIRTVAVLPLENLSGFTGASDSVADMIATSLYGAKRFDIRERAETLRLAAKAGVKVPATIDRGTALKIGRALHVDGVFFGTITEYQYLFFPEDAVVGFQLELLDVESGQVVWRGLFNDRHYGLLQGSDEPISTLAQDGIKSLVTLLAPPVPEAITNGIPPTPSSVQGAKRLQASTIPE